MLPNRWILILERFRNTRNGGNQISDSTHYLKAGLRIHPDATQHRFLETQCSHLEQEVTTHTEPCTLIQAVRRGQHKKCLAFAGCARVSKTTCPSEQTERLWQRANHNPSQFS